MAANIPPPLTITLLRRDTPHVKAALEEEAKLFSELNKALAKDLQSRANLALQKTTVQC